MRYELLEKDKDRFISLVLLNEIINQQVYPPVKVIGEDIYLDNYLKLMLSKGWLEVKNDVYIPTPAGRTELESFYVKYSEYLKLFDIFCAVDLTEGTFAFEEINNPAFDDDRWADFLANERFSDVRVAVAEFKGINPIEIVFMSFLTEGRFEVGIERWQHNLTGNNIWNEIIDICNTGITKEYLDIDGVLENVIIKGAEISLELLKQIEPEKLSDDKYLTEEITEEYVEVVEIPIYDYDYYYSYYDPYYVSPIWLV